jgi:hypothetical protein
MQRQTELKKWLQSIFPDQSFELTFAAADADFRRYFRATFSDGQSIICMDAPPDKMSIAPYLKVQKLFDMVNVPQVLAADEALGFMALSDLGNTTFLAAIEHDEREIAHKALLLEAIDELVVLQKASRAGELPEYRPRSDAARNQPFPRLVCGQGARQNAQFQAAPMVAANGRHALAAPARAAASVCAPRFYRAQPDAHARPPRRARFSRCALRPDFV